MSTVLLNLITIKGISSDKKEDNLLSCVLTDKIHYNLIIKSLCRQKLYLLYYTTGCLISRWKSVD
jgi:hypothetical protein